MIIDIWADVAHLDSYLAKVAWESALAEREHSDEVQIVWHSYQVDRPQHVRRAPAAASRRRGGPRRRHP